MANRTLEQFSYSSAKMATSVFLQVTFGATGAPTINNGNSFVSGMVRNSAGDYTITFRDEWPALLMAKHVFNSGSSAPAAPGMYIKANSSSVNATRTMEIVFNTAGTATDPASGEIVYLQLIFRNSSIINK